MIATERAKRENSLRQKSCLQAGILEKKLAYWQKKLANAPTLLQLPTDYPRPAEQSYRGARQTFDLSFETTQRLERFSEDSGVTLYMTLLSVFGTLLYRYSGQSDILIGSPIANRNRSEIEPLMGCFINTLVMRLNIEKDASFAQLLNQVQETTIDSYDHQDAPFEQVVEALQPERSLSYSPLFQVMFILQNAPQAALELPGVTLTPLSSETLSTKFDLTLSMELTASGLVGSWEYCTDLFSVETISRMTGHFEQLLECAVKSPETTVSRMPLLTSAEQHQLLVDWNDTAVAYPQESCIHQLFENQVEQTPDAIALTFEGECLTYRELNARSNQLAHYLQQLGVQPETLVGICVERSLEMVIGLLGILKAGGAYVPLDPSYPVERLQFMLQDSAVPVLLTQASLLDGLPPHDAQVVCMDSDAAKISECCPANVASPVQSSNLAYIIYTSGSTGQPKGVILQHQSVVNFLISMKVRPGFKPADCLNAITTLSFDIAVLELYLPLICGSQVNIVSRQVASDGRELALQLQQKQCTVMQATPATWEMLADSSLPKLDQDFSILCGGEGLSFSLSEKLLTVTDKLWNLYGPTEATVWSACYQVQPRVGIDAIKGYQPIGRPIANTQIYLLDRHQQPVPIGVAGELNIGGAGLARGYLNRPELTAEKFIDNPFGPGRLYKTGDLARYLPNGDIEYLGRIDSQVKIRGFRIELGEIEFLLSNHPQIQQVVVIVREDTPGDKRIVAYIVSQDLQPTSETLRTYCTRQLPNYMVPSAFVQLEYLPLTPNGKVNRKLLPVPGTLTTRLEKDFVKPRTQIEAKLVKIWSNLLQIEQVSIFDNFFELGGHSLMAVKLFAQIEQEFGQQLPLATLFQASTIEKLAHKLQVSEGGKHFSSLVKIQSGGSKVPLFCIHGGGANVLNFRELAHALSVEQPVFAFQSRGLDGRDLPLTSIEDMALAYLEELRTVQPQGPYFLAGYCLGSLIALEMANQLNLEGEEVALLALLEPSGVQSSGNLRGRSIKQRLLEKGNDLRIRFLMKGVSYNAKEIYLKTLLRLSQFFRLPLSSEMCLIRVKENNIRAARKYVSNVVCLCKATLFLTDETIAKTPEIEQNWGNVVSEVERIKISGRHQDDHPDSFFKMPHVKELAAKLKKSIDRAI